MEWTMIFKAVLALAFVLGLLLLTLWLIKYCEIHGTKNRFMKKLNAHQRINIIETKRLDAKNTLVLFARDEVEHLVLLGNTQNLVVETMVAAKKAKK